MFECNSNKQMKRTKRKCIEIKLDRSYFYRKTCVRNTFIYTKFKFKK